MREFANWLQVGARPKMIKLSQERLLRVKVGKVLWTRISLEAENGSHHFFKLSIGGASLNSLTNFSKVLKQWR
jgi:hypothetical protein